MNDINSDSCNSQHKQTKETLKVQNLVSTQEIILKIETLEHLFFGCPFTKGICESILMKIHPFRKRAKVFVDE